MNKNNKTSDTYTPTEYFNLLKEKKHTINDEELKQQLNKLNKTQNGDFRMTNNIENKKSFFKKIFSFMRNNKWKTTLI